jgi:hypothetical protein
MRLEGWPRIACFESSTASFCNVQADTRALLQIADHAESEFNYRRNLRHSHSNMLNLLVEAFAPRLADA